jgi:hypothetical protein
MIEKIISGGQTGADPAGWRAARAYGIPTGGSMPLGFLMEDGPRPEFTEQYGAAELATSSDPARTERNVRDSDGTVRFGDPSTPGGRLTPEWCRNAGKTSVTVDPGGPTLPSHVAAWIREHRTRTLHVVGNPDSEAQEIGDRVKRFFGVVLRQLGFRPLG